MIEYRVEFTDCRGKTTVKPWVKCDLEMARRAAREAIGAMGFFHWPNITIRKRETIETVAFSHDRPEFINDHLPNDQRGASVDASAAVDESYAQARRCAADAIR